MIRRWSESSTATSFPAVTIGSWTSFLEGAVVSTMTRIGTLCTATQAVCQTTAATDKDVLEGEGGREGGWTEGEMEGWGRDGGREGEREGVREGGRDGGMEGWRDGGNE